MVGRDRELDLLRAVWSESLDGEPRIAVVSGEAGIGKTRLLDEFRRLRRLDDDAVIALGQCVEFGTLGIPYAPLSGLLRELTTAFGAAELEEAAGAGAPALLTVAEGMPAERSGVDRIDEAFTVALERLSAVRPLLLIVEDLHWSDPATLDVLRFVSRVARSGRLMLLLSFRDEEVGRGHPLREFLADLDRNRRAVRIPVQRLTAREVRAQAHDLIGAVPTAADARRLHERSEGVPFFVEELLALGASGAPVPSTLREVLLARYDALASEVRGVCRAIAAAGESVGHPLLQRVVGPAPDDLDDWLRAAIDAGVIVSDGRAYDFRHALVREAVGGQSLPGERVRWHTRYAEEIAAELADPADRTAHAVRVAHHWFQAIELDRAFAAALDAMRLSLDSFAYATAAQLGERAVELWDRVPEPSAVAGANLAEHLARTALAWRWAGEPSRALSTVERALEEVGDTDIVLRATLLREKGMLLDSTGRGNALTDLEGALASLPDGTAPGLRAEILLELAAQYMFAGRGDESLAAAARASADAPPDAARTRSFAANIRGAVLLYQGHIEEGMAAYDQALSEADGDIDALLRYYTNRSDALQMLGRHAESVDLAEQGRQIAASAGVERTSGAMLAVNIVDPLFALGQWDRADRLVDDALELDPPLPFQAYLRRAKIRSTLWRGDVAEALTLWRDWRASLVAVSDGEEQSRASQALDITDLHLAAGDLDAAWEVAAQLLGERRLASPPQELPLAPSLARTIAQRRRSSGDPALHDADEQRLRQVIERDLWPTSALWQVLADAEVSGPDRSGSDTGMWHAARAVAARPEMPIVNGLMVELGLARSLVMEGERSAAAATLGALRERAESIGAGLVVRWADELFASAGLSARQRSGQDTDGAQLTAREQQVLDLVTEGMTNIQIAEQLFLSPKTVSVHVSAILRKFGATTRTEAVRIAGRRE